jgi:hypothetical protein
MIFIKWRAELMRKKQVLLIFLLLLNVMIFTSCSKIDALYWGNDTEEYSIKNNKNIYNIVKKDNIVYTTYYEGEKGFFVIQKGKGIIYKNKNFVVKSILLKDSVVYLNIYKKDMPDRYGIYYYNNVTKEIENIMNTFNNINEFYIIDDYIYFIEDYADFTKKFDLKRINIDNNNIEVIDNGYIRNLSMHDGIVYFKKLEGKKYSIYKYKNSRIIAESKNNDYYFFYKDKLYTIKDTKLYTDGNFANLTIKNDEISKKIFIYGPYMIYRELLDKNNNRVNNIIVYNLDTSEKVLYHNEEIQISSLFDVINNNVIYKTSDQKSNIFRKKEFIRYTKFINIDTKEIGTMWRKQVKN